MPKVMMTAATLTATSAAAEATAPGVFWPSMRVEVGVRAAVGVEVEDQL